MKGMKGSVEKMVIKHDLNLPTHIKTKADNLIRNIGIVWNEKYELFVNGESIPGSDIHTILTHHFENPNGSPPIGYRDFLLYITEKGVYDLKPPGVQQSISSDTKIGKGKWIELKIRKK